MREAEDGTPAAAGADKELARVAPDGNGWQWAVTGRAIGAMGDAFREMPPRELQEHKR